MLFDFFKLRRRFNAKAVDGVARAAVGRTASSVPRDIAIAEGAMWMGGHVVHYPVRRGELINLSRISTATRGSRNRGRRQCDLSELTTTSRALRRGFDGESLQEAIIDIAPMCVSLGHCPRKLFCEVVALLKATAALSQA
jgi:hypothetical protein